MTQLSPYTLPYDQIAKAVAELVEKWSKGNYITKQDIIEDFNKSLNDLYLKIGSSKTEFEQFIKGEPPSSAKINRFLRSLKDDINNSAKQLDYLSSKAVNVFNFFTSEVESEKKYIERINSKAKVLQMYSQSPADDIVYVGDSFDNHDYIDSSKYIIDKIPLILNGQLSLQSVSRSDWQISRIVINKSNGFIGNNHVVVRSNSGVNPNGYRYVFEESPSMGNKNNIIDKNPLTYFEYEAINVNKDNLGQAVIDQEFSYIVDDESLVNEKRGNVIDWSSHNLSEPLIFDFSLISQTAQKCNSITITPYFASSKLIKIKNVLIKTKEGNEISVLKQPIYIGSSPENLTTESFGFYFLNKAVISFEEVEAIEARVVIEQDKYQDVEIQHLYWKTNYLNGFKDESPFYGVERRFNPSNIDKTLYNASSFNRELLMPVLTNPNSFKVKNITGQIIPVEVLKKDSKSSTRYNIPIVLEKEILNAKRMSIGLRDVSLSYDEYAPVAQIVSRPFNFDLPVESVILNIEADQESFTQSSSLINAYVSVDNCQNWLRISPIQSGYVDGDEVLAFNQNVPSGYKLPGVTYYSYPDVPKEIKTVHFKMEILKNQTTNKTPVIYSYTLGAKVKKS